MNLAALKRFLVGEPLPTQRLVHERLSKTQGLAVLSSDALSSVAYAAEEILLALVAAGLAAFAFAVPVGVAIVLVMALVVLSYREIVLAYPLGGGAYHVARENIGVWAGLTAGASLIVDYILTVAVSVAAGVAAITSAFPGLAEHRVGLGLAAIAVIAIGNLRGVREAGALFTWPPYIFISLFALMILTALVHPFGGLPAPPVVPAQTHAITAFLILRAFAGGCVALTGVEAVSDGAGAFHPPEGKNAAKVLVALGLILSTFFVGSTWVAHHYLIGPAERETVISQIARVAFGNSVLYYAVQAATALILVFAANTSFNGLPRLASILAQGGYLPRQLANLGDRLVFSNGILLLVLLSGGLLVLFGGDTHAMIPLYAVGVFTGFTLAQAGMLRRHLKQRPPGWRRGLVINGLGCLATAVVLVVQLVTKFTGGSWITAALIGLLVVLFYEIREHYSFYARELSSKEWQPVWPRKHVVVVPVAGVSRSTASALAYALLLSQNVRAVCVTPNPDGGQRLQDEWDLWDSGVPLEVVVSPYRSIVRPLLEFINRVEEEERPDWLTVVLPEVVPARWWHAFLHNQTVYMIKAALLFRKNVVVTTVRHHLGR